MGDGLLAEFASVVDALRCAVAVQRELTGRSADLDLEKRIALRIGINIGDVVVGIFARLVPNARRCVVQAFV